MKKGNVEKILRIIKDSNSEDLFFREASTMDDPFPLLEPLKDNGYFEPEKNPLPQEDPENEGYFLIPHWNIFGYLNNVATKNIEKRDAQITKILLDIIDSIINSSAIDNYRSNQALIKIIFKLPIECIDKTHIKFIKRSLESRWNVNMIEGEIRKTVFPRLIKEESEELLCELLLNILDYKKEDKKTLWKYDSIMDNYTLKIMLDEYKPQIANICGIKAATVGVNKISSIVKEDPSQFGYISIPTIEDHPQAHPEEYECQLVYFVRDMLNSINYDQIKEREIIIELKEKEHPIFKRIAINVISNHFKELNSLFLQWNGNPLQDINLKHEIYEFFSSNALKFNSKQIKMIINWIESKNYHIPPENEEYCAEILAYDKKEWLLPLLTSGNEEVIYLYNNYNRINTSEVEHPGFNFWIGHLTPTQSSLDKSTFLTKSNEEIVKYLINYKPEGPFFTEFALSETFRNSITEKPRKFTENIKPFLKVKSLYQHALLWGLQEAWQKKRKFEWGPVFDFINNIIKSQDFWTKEYEKGYYVNWMIGTIADLIEEGTKNDDNAFNPELLPKAREILIILMKNTKSGLKKTSDVIINVLNSEKGKIFSAMINYSLRYARIHSNKNEKWDIIIKNEFTKRLNKHFEPSIEFIVTVARYLPNLCYLDNNWIKININQIFDKQDDERWNAAFAGYLSYSDKFYENIYSLLKKEGHYDKAIESNFDNKHIIERLVQQICLLYLRDKEDLSDEESLIFKLVKNGSSDHLLAIIGFFWINREKLTDDQKVKIKPLWKKIFNRVSQDEENKENQVILSKLSRWLSLIDYIDIETFNWLKLSVKYLNRDNMDSFFFIDYLQSHLNKNLSEVGQLYIIMLENNIFPEFKEKETKRIVRCLYLNNQRRMANRIRYLYGIKGFKFLEESYEEFDKS